MACSGFSSQHFTTLFVTKISNNSFLKNKKFTLQYNMDWPSVQNVRLALLTALK